MNEMRVQIKANAKVNLTLSVGDVLDNGMHLIESKMARVAFFDDIEITMLDSHATSRYTILWHEDAPRKTEIDWLVTDDLAVRAHCLIEKVVGHTLPVQMKLEKRIPVGGGLGGGSADAAAMLQAVTRLFQLDLDVCKNASSLGSDVPYLLHGGSCVVGGTGDVITPIKHETQHLVLMIPPYSCETSEVYRAFDALEYHETNSGNDLLTPACVVEPRLATDMETATTLLDQEIHLSGSGSTMFAICDNAEHAAETAKKLEEHTELVAIATQTCEEVLERI